MHVSCSACGKRLQIPDDKLPTDRQVRIACPACHERFTVEPPPQAPAPSTPSSPPLNIDLAEAGLAPRALICLDTASHRDECASIVPSLGINTVHVISNQTQALAYLSQVAYNLVILDATFDGSTPEANPILACIHELSMQQRRHMFVMLCTPDTEATDTMTAYSHSINLIINHAEVLTCRRVLEQHLTEHKRLYRTYHELRQELGKD
jgi:PleD family two-component response regulator